MGSIIELKHHREIPGSDSAMTETRAQEEKQQQNFSGK